MPTITEMMKISTSRALRWHKKDGLRGWSILEWCGAMCGEAGEAANIAKKIMRHDHEMYNGQETAFNPLDRDSLKEKLAQELADTFIYSLLCAAREEIDLEAAIVRYFNKKSVEAGFPERF